MALSKSLIQLGQGGPLYILRSHRLAHILFFIFFSGNIYILCILKGILPFKMHKIIFFPEHLEKNQDLTNKFR